MKRLVALLLSLGVALSLSGCGLRGPSELYALPRVSAEYESLQDCLEELIAGGYEYAAPLAGENTQSVQMQDLDGDGRDEAVAFFRDNSGEAKPIKICIFRADEAGVYSLVNMIEGDGDAINSVVYCQLNDTPAREIVVGWRISSTVLALSAYAIDNYNVTELLSATNYTRYMVRDMDQDNQSEIVVLQMTPVEEGGSQAGYYDWREDTVMEINSVPLSNSMSAIQSVVYNYLVDFTPALYVSGTEQDSTNMLVTDILAVSDGLLTNITLNEELGISETRHGSAVAARDINNDSVIELPFTISLSANAYVENSEVFSVLSWGQYDLSGRESTVGYTYHNVADGWYLQLPALWSWKLDRLVLSRSDTNLGATVERSIQFYFADADDPESEPEQFLVIYKNTGQNRHNRAVMGNRFLLLETDDASYSAEFIGAEPAAMMDQASLTEAFHLITTDWSSE